MKTRLLLLGIIGAIFGTFALAMASNPSRDSSRRDAAAPPRPGSPPIDAGGGAGRNQSLRGERAIRELKKQGTYHSLGEAVEAASYSINPVPSAPLTNSQAGYEAANPAQALQTHFTGDEVRVLGTSERNWQLGLKLRSYGYGAGLVPVVSGEMKAQGDRIEITKRERGTLRPLSLVEWYVNKPGGLEQGFTLSAPPPAATRPQPPSPARLRMVIEITGDLRGELREDGQAVLLTDREGRHISTYDHLKAWDATGRVLPSRMQVHGREVSLEVDDAGAVYPVTIDPTLWQQQAQLTAGSAGRQFDLFGWSVAVSGNTAIVGAREDNFTSANQGGSAYVFVRRGGGWSLQQRLRVGAA